jgi:hypothetical protein
MGEKPELSQVGPVSPTCKAGQIIDVIYRTENLIQNFWSCLVIYYSTYPKFGNTRENLMEKGFFSAFPKIQFSSERDEFFLGRSHSVEEFCKG